MSTDNLDRAVFSLGKGYKDLVRIRRGDVTSPTDAVIRPDTEDQLLEILRVAARRQLAVIPFGGGTSVVGGVEPPAGADHHPRHGRLQQAPRNRPRVRNRPVQAGIMGPDLERYLTPPASLSATSHSRSVYSTVGGWIATRSAGQNSTRYGTIEELVQSLRLAHPEGILARPSVPAAAAGPDLVQMVVGSEGTLGVITQAVLRLLARPEVRDYRGYLLPSFAEGVQAARELMQADIAPAVLRLSDECEDRIQPGPAGALRRVSRLPSSVPAAGISAAKASTSDSGSIMILGFEGSESAVRHEARSRGEDPQAPRRRLARSGRRPCLAALDASAPRTSVTRCSTAGS